LKRESSVQQMLACVQRGGKGAGKWKETDQTRKKDRAVKGHERAN